MKNKAFFIQFLFLLFTGLLFNSCKEEEFKEVKINPVENLYIPETDKVIQLVTTENANLYFEWEKATSEDNGVLYYDVLFDKEDGDFSNPVHSVMADNQGTSTGATVSHQILNRAAKFAGIPSGGTGIIKWTVRASRGLSHVVSTQSRRLLVTRLNGIDAPTALFITGEATETGADIANALAFRMTTDETADIFTRLTAGKTFRLVNTKNEEFADNYYVENGLIKEGKGTSSVEKDGIYHISVNFSTGATEIQEIDKVEFFMCTPRQRVEMAYQGNGTWKAENIKPDFDSNWKDDRYFYYMQKGGTQYKLGSANVDNQAPGSLSGSYFDIGFFGTESDQWNYSFKFPADMKNAEKGTVIVDMVLYLNDTKYTNEIIKKY